jgi:hypothetical protein
MGARLRVVLDQLVQVVDPDHAAASIELTRGLVATAPSGCDVEAIVAAGSEASIPGVAEVRTLGLARRELAASWQLGIAAGAGGGLIHSPTLMAPLVRHDRTHDNDQTTVTVWSLEAWEAPDGLSRAAVAWQKSMLRRAAKHADAIVVPTHTIAQRIQEIARVGDRVRVIAGAAPEGFVTPFDAGERRTTLSLPERYVVVHGTWDSVSEGFRAALAAGAHAVVLDAAEGTEPRYSDIASSAGLSESRVHVRGALGPDDRAAVLSGTAAYVASSPTSAWPWRAVEAMRLGVPVVGVDSGTHRDVIADGGLLVDSGDLPDAVERATGGESSRLSVLAADRSRAFSWAGSAERVWGLHADL